MSQDKSSDRKQSEALALVLAQLNQQTAAITQLTEVITAIAMELSRGKRVIRQNGEIVGLQ